MPLPLAEIFPDEDYRFHLTLRKGELAEFFGRNDQATLRERAAWLQLNPELYVGAIEGADAGAREFEELAAGWGVLESVMPSDLSMRSRLVELGGRIEADFLILRERASTHYVLESGVVCFPSSWDPAEKFGRTLEAIHGVVPRLNPSLGGSIGQFLQKLKPGVAFERANWGIAATSERNMHPARNCPGLTRNNSVDDVWIRVEDQLLTRMPVTGCVLFGIKIRVLPLQAIWRDKLVRRGLLRALRTMPDDVAKYKGLSVVRDVILAAGDLERETP